MIITNTFKKIRNFIAGFGSDPRRMLYIFGVMILIIIAFTVILSIRNATPKSGNGVNITKDSDGNTVVEVTNKDLAKLSNDEIKKKLGVSGDKVIIFVPAALRPRPEQPELEITPDPDYGPGSE